jgi:hypothetical protein
VVARYLKRLGSTSCDETDILKTYNGLVMADVAVGASIRFKNRVLMAAIDIVVVVVVVVVVGVFVVVVVVVVAASTATAECDCDCDVSPKL